MGDFDAGFDMDIGADADYDDFHDADADVDEVEAGDGDDGGDLQFEDEFTIEEIEVPPEREARTRVVARDAPRPTKDPHAPRPLRIQRGYWTSTLCSCFEALPNCFLAFCCPWVSAAQSAHRLNKSFTGWLVIMLVLLLTLYGCVAGVAVIVATSNGEPDANPALGMALVVAFALTIVAIARLREATRTTYAIPGQKNEDCGLALCCPCCVLAQLGTHLQTYARGSCNFGHRPTSSQRTHGPERLGSRAVLVVGFSHS